MINFGELYDKTQQLFFDILLSPNFYVFILLCCILFYAAYRIYYKSYIEPKNNNYKANSEYIKDTKEDVDLYIFHTTWCPHSKKAVDVIKKFQKENISVKGKTINYYYIDAEEQEDLAEKFNVESYPSVYLVVNDNRIYYDANVKEPLLKKFLETSI
tara:strand:+ start:1959 stop:2429 length:471 start_codon:yes stop_codon:yes gene_type:complete